MNTIFPWEYTTEEGGTFKRWCWGSIDPLSLTPLGEVRNLKATVLVNGIAVNCLIFETAAAGHGNYARWDVVNGWTKTIEQAKLAWPQGQHGQKPPYLI